VQRAWVASGLASGLVVVGNVPDHPTVATALDNLAAVLRHLGEPGP
jgi:hypothetical protein